MNLDFLLRTLIWWTGNTVLNFSGNVHLSGYQVEDEDGLDDSEMENTFDESEEDEDSEGTEI